MADEDQQDNGSRSVVDADDLLAGYVDVDTDVVDSTSQRRSSPFTSPSSSRPLGVVPEEEDTTTAAPPPAGRVVSPPPVVQVPEIPRAHAEEGPHHDPSPRRRRGTPTAAQHRRRQQSQSQIITYEDLRNRPRSNPRSRTPMRHESPLNHDAFHSDRVINNNNNNNSSSSSSSNYNHNPHPIIRLGSGADRGVHRPVPISLATTSTTTKSSKQRPSHRKNNRWNNDNFVNTISDLATSSCPKSRAAAKILAAAQADAVNFLPIYDFTTTDCSTTPLMTQFLQEEKFRDLRDQFFAGSGMLSATTRATNSSRTTKSSSSQQPSSASAADLYRRIDGRLQRVVVKACENSGPACRVVETFEEYLVNIFSATTATAKEEGGGEEEPTPQESSRSSTVDDQKKEFWDGILLERPSVTYYDDADNMGTTTKSVSLLFDGTSPSGGFHRLLVHAVSSFHCLKAKTSTVCSGTEVVARVLVVQGDIRGSNHRLLDHLASLQQQRQQRQ